MSQPFRTVAKGLRWVFVGCWLTPGIVAVALCFFCLLNLLALSQPAPWVFASIALAFAMLSVISTFVSPVGRLMCLATPPEVAVARTRIRLAVLFEVCSILSGISGIVIAIAGLLPGEIVSAGFLFTLLTGVIARLFFLLYARSLAEHIGATDEAVPAKTIFQAALGLIVSGVLSAGGFAIANVLPVGNDIGTPRAVVLTLAATIMCLGVICLLYLGVGYFMLFSTLWQKVQAFADAAPGEEEERETSGEP